MSEKILVPELGESITEATLAKWLKKKGDSINADEALVELETDKVNLEVPSPISGIISETIFAESKHKGIPPPGWTLPPQKYRFFILLEKFQNFLYLPPL